MATYSFVTGDTGRVIRLTVSDEDVPYDLSAAQSVKLRWKQRGVVQERDMVVSDAANGVCTYTPEGDDFFAGEVNFEVEIVNATGDIISSQDLIGPHQIRKELG